MTNSSDSLSKKSIAVKIQEKISLAIMLVLFVVGCLTWIVVCYLKMPVKQFSKYCSDFLLIEID